MIRSEGAGGGPRVSSACTIPPDCPTPRPASLPLSPTGPLFYPINKAAIDKNETYNWECVVLCTNSIVQDCCVHKCHVEVIVCTSWVYTHPRNRGREEFCGRYRTTRLFQGYYYFFTKGEHVKMH